MIRAYEDGELVTTRSVRKKDASIISEDVIQGRIVKWIRRNVPQVFVFHPANGGWRTPRQAEKFRKIGVVAGVPDLIILAPGGRVFCLECKAKKGALSDVQKAMTRKLDDLGIGWAVARSVEDAEAAFASWGFVV